MKNLLLSLGLAFAMSGTAFAQTPPEVLKPYKEYRAALEAGEKDKAYNAAKKAWETAEGMLGDHKTTGDLALNFAVLTPSVNKYSYKEYKLSMKAYKRAISLSHFYAEKAVDVELERHLKRIETGLTLVQIKNGKAKSGGKTTYFKEMEEALDKYGKRGSTFEGDMEVLRVRHYEFSEQPEKGVEAAKRAEVIYKNRKDNIITPYPVFLKLFKGNILRDADEPIKAVLQYQEVMQNLEGKLPADHQFVSTAFTEWMLTRSELVEDGRLEEAQRAGLCKCWPFEEYKDDVIPLKRVPPVMPRNARRSGHVNLIFDVNADGRPENIRVLNSTEKVFEKPAATSVAKWVYSPAGRQDDPKMRKDVAGKITFRLTNASGKIIPEKR